MSRQEQIDKMAAALLFGDCGLEWRYAAELLREYYRTKAQMLVDKGFGDENRFYAHMCDHCDLRPIDYEKDKGE